MSIDESPSRGITETRVVYYVDSVNGNDNASGTSENQAWKTFKWFAGLTLQPGDRVLLKSGSSWNEPLILNGQGTAEAPIILSSYGIGSLPLIYGTDIKKDVCVTINNPSYWQISNVDLRNAKLGLYLRYIASSGNRDVSVTGCNFRDMPDTVADAGLNNFEFAWSAGICIGGLLGPDENITVLDGLTVKNNSFHNTGVGVISSWYFPGVYKRRLVNVLVENNTADYCYGGGFAFTYATDVVVRNFSITNSGGASHFGTTAGFLQSTDNVLIEYCEMASTKAVDCHDGVGMDFEGNNTNTVFRYNYVHGNDGPGILFCTTEGINQGVTVTGNVIFNNGLNAYNNDYKFEFLNWTERDQNAQITGYNSGTISNNTIMRKWGNGFFSSGTATAGVPFEWNNFTISGNSQSYYWSTPPAKPGMADPVLNSVSWDFAYDGDLLGWNTFNHWDSATVSSDVLWGLASGTDMFAVGPEMRLNAIAADTLEVRMRTTQSNVAQLFFVTESEPYWDGAKSIAFNLIPGNDMKTYTVDLSSLAAWDGIVNTIRLDPSMIEGDTLAIDYIRLY
ncbi:MAG: right-handed parallel beta-helix repeat-containing protein [Spirochaetales bacterium]|nr:right-handed parallel beta-helix repeat-containing protein [Spirochaetales bacterium]